MKQSEINPVGVRFPPELRDALRRAAQENSRSLNRQVVIYVTQGLRIEGFAIKRARIRGNRAAEQGAINTQSA